MPLRPGTETALVAGATLLCTAFLVSFVLGLRGSPPAPQAVTRDAGTVLVPAVVLGRVEVLNASGRGGLARSATDRLRGNGFDVVYFGNAGSAFDRDTSVVIDRSGDDRVARAAARVLGIAAVRTQVDSSLFLDATVVLAADRLVEEPAPAPQPGFWQRALDWVRPGR